MAELVFTDMVGLVKPERWFNLVVQFEPGTDGIELFLFLNHKDLHRDSLCQIDFDQCLDLGRLVNVKVSLGDVLSFDFNHFGNDHLADLISGLCKLTLKRVGDELMLVLVFKDFEIAQEVKYEQSMEIFEVNTKL